MTDLSWISQEAKTLHAMFEQVFYGVALVLLLLGVVTEYFKFSVGGMPQFGQLAGRLLVAAILLNTYPEVSNAIADFTDALANQLGSLDSVKLVLSKYWDKLSQLQLSWTSIKDSVLMLISFVTFFLLYISVYIADAAITYAWVLLYVFSPLSIALYVLPVTSGATKALYRSLFEISAWKIVWAVLAALLWSSALSQINQPGANINFITAVSFNLILAGSLLLTPFVVNALAGAGLSTLAAQTAGIAAGAASLSPGQIATQFGKKKMAGRSVRGGPGDGDEGPRPSSFTRFQEKYSNEGGSPPRSSTSSTGVSANVKVGQSTGGPATVKSVSKSSVAKRNQNQSPSVNQTNTDTHVSFKSAVRSFKSPPNRSEYQRQPVQRALFTESTKPTGKKS